MNAHILAVSGDKEAKQAEFRESIGADFSFIADPKATLISDYQVKMPLLKLAKRVTYVIGKDRKVLAIDSGSSALSPDGAAAACKLF